jgi:glycosyltransferase involved in cell wall biosynthesis
MQNTFVIVIPVYNSAKYIGKCLYSVLSQTYKNYTVIVIDDHSSDGTYDIAWETGFNVIRNYRRTGSPLGNMKLGIEKASFFDTDIIVLLDGDDWFSDNKVLEYLNDIYQDDTWMTYGQFEPLSKTYKDFSKPIIDTRTYRKSCEWHTSAPKTFRRFLWDKIKDEDLKFRGQYAKEAADRACLYPMIEMSGKHCKFIDKILYIYNDLNPNNFFKINPKGSLEAAQYFIDKPIYEEL